MEASLAQLNQVDFVDLYLGPDFCDVKRVAPGKVFSRAPLSGHEPMLETLRERCGAERAMRNYDEFGLRIACDVGETIYRVTTITGSRGQPVYVLRKSSASLRSLSELGLSPVALETIALPQLSGLVLVAGETASGKTSTIASLVAHRLRRFGGVALTIEQPIEVPLEGLHGDGRCIQHEISQEENEYAEALKLSLRTNPNLIMLGEIRHMETAAEAVLAGMNGHLIVSTIHANSIENAIERFSALASLGLGYDEMRDARSLVASSLSLVVHQKLVPSSQSPRLVTRSLSFIDEQLGGSMRAKIREGRISTLNQDIDRQHTQASWSSSSTTGR